MTQGVVIDMRKENALATVAMYCALYETKNKNNFWSFYDAYILRVLPQSIGARIDINTICSELYEQFALQIPSKLIKERLLPDLCRRGFCRSEDHNFYVLSFRDFNIDDFESKRNALKSAQESVVKGLVDFVDKTFGESIDSEKAQSYLIAFFDKRGYSVATDQTEDLYELKSKEDGKEMFFVAQFILAEYKIDSVIFNHIVQYVRGFFVYKGVYFLQGGIKKSVDSKLRGTAFYLDTALLINLLGFGSSEEENAFEELRKLIVANNGAIKTFSHCVEELRGIMSAYINKPEERTGFSLAFNIPDGVISLFRDGLEELINDRGVKIEYNVPYGTITSDEDAKNKGILNEVALKSYISNLYSDVNGSSIEKDVRSIAATSRLRRSGGQDIIESCKAVFLTNNAGLARLAKAFYLDAYPNTQTPLVITDLELTSLLWLNNMRSYPDTPKTRLIEDAYATYYPSRELINAFRKRAESLVEEGKVRFELVLNLLCSRNSKAILSESFYNDVNLVTKENTEKVLANHLNEITTKAIEDATADKNSIILQQQEEMNNIISQQQVEMNKQQAELEAVKRKFTDLKRRDYEAVHAQASKARERVLLISRITTGILWGLIGVLLLLAFVDDVRSTHGVAALISAVVMIIGAIDTFCSERRWILKKFFTKLAGSVYTKTYERATKELEKRYEGQIKKMGDN